jgi:hypothetical protein
LAWTHSGDVGTMGLQTPMVPGPKAPTLRSRNSRRPPFSNFPLVKGFQSRHSGTPTSPGCGCLARPLLLEHGANADVLDNEYQVTPAD